MRASILCPPHLLAITSYRFTSSNNASCSTCNLYPRTSYSSIQSWKPLRSTLRCTRSEAKLRAYPTRSRSLERVASCALVSLFLRLGRAKWRRGRERVGGKGKRRSACKKKRCVSLSGREEASFRLFFSVFLSLFLLSSWQKNKTIYPTKNSKEK